MAINKNKLIASAQRLTQRGQLDRAIKEYRTIVEHDPDDVRVWMKIGALYVRKGATQHAVATYNRVAAYYQESGHHQKAAAVYKQIIGLVPGAIDAHLQLAEVLARLGQNVEAVNELQIVVGAYERDGRHRDSCGLLARIVELAPDEEANRIRLAEAYARQNDNDAAIREFRQVLEQLYRNQRFDDFIQVAERLLYLAPGQIDTVRQLAEVYLQRSQPKRALSRLQVLFQNDPTDTTVLEMLGQAFNDLGYRGKAISVYRELARIHGTQGAEGARLSAFRSLLAIDPKDPEALEATGAADRFSSPPQSQATSVSPRPSAEPASDDDQVARYLEDVELYLKYELTDHAVARLDKIFVIDPSNIAALSQRAELMRQLDNPAEAAKIYRQLADNAEGEQAMSFLGKLIEIRPDDIDAQARLRSLSGDMASAHGKVVTLPPAAPSDEPYEVELNLDGVDFDDGLEDAFAIIPEGAGESLDFELDLDGLEPAPDDDAFSDLLGAEAAASVESGQQLSRRAFGDLSADDEFGDLLEPDASTSLGASDYDDVDALGDLIDAPAGDAEFGDLLSPSDDWSARPLDDGDGDGEYGALLASSPDAEAEPDAEFGGLVDSAPNRWQPPAVEDDDSAEPQASISTHDDELAAPDSGDAFDNVISLAPPPAAEGLLAPEPLAPAPERMTPLGFSDVADDQVIELADDSFGDLLADLEEEYGEEAPETAEVLAPGDISLEDALAAAALDEAVDQSASGVPEPSSVPDVDFGALDVAPETAPISVDLDALDFDGAPSADVDLGVLDGIDDDVATDSFEVELAPATPAEQAAHTPSEAEQIVDEIDDLFGADEERALPVGDDSPFDSLLEQMVPDAAPDDFESEAVVAALPGVMDALASSVDLVDDDDIIELDDDEFEVEDVAPGTFEPVAIDPPPPPSGARPPTPPSLRERLSRISAQNNRPAPPPLPGGNLFDLRTNEAVSEAPEPISAEPIEESLAGAEFFNISGEVEWPAIGTELAELDFLLGSRLVSEARELLSELSQEHPGHPALSERLDRILEIEASGLGPVDADEESTFAGPMDAPTEAALTDGALLNSVEESPDLSLGDVDADALLGGLDDAEVDFGTVQGSMLSDLDEDDASTHFDLGVAFKEMGQYKKAIESLTLARQSQELYAEATRLLAAAHHERGESSDAVDLLREAIADERVSQGAQLGLRYELAGVFETVGRHAEAADELRVIAQIAPTDFPDVGARLARLS